MGQFLAKMLESISWGQKNLSIVMLGLDAAGKGSIPRLILMQLYITHSNPHSTFISFLLCLPRRQSKCVHHISLLPTTYMYVSLATG